LSVNERPRALFLAPEAPYPLAGGGALRTASVLHYLARKYVVDAILFHHPGAPQPATQLPPGLVDRVVTIELPPNRRGGVARGLRNALRLARRVPPLVDRFAGFEQEVEAFIAKQRYELGVIEHFWCAPYWERIGRVCRRTVLDLHNIESVLHERCAQAEGGPQGLAHRVFADAAMALERTWIARFSDVLVTSAHDKTVVLQRAPSARVTVYPNALPFTPVPLRDKEDVIVFSGNLEYHPNVSGVRFFRRRVWPLLREQWPHLAWRLVGKNPAAVRAWTGGDPRIQVRGPVADAVQELARAKVAVVPLLAGSGTRVKILEAWAAALPVVSTRIGAEGLPVRDGHHVLLADEGTAFASAVSKLLESAALRETLGNAGRKLWEEEFTWEKAWRSFDL
jgi:polysaccharide biosynthesis protein PslH